MTTFTHWLMALDAPARFRVFGAMREIGGQCETEWTLGRLLAPGPGEVAIGGEDFDHVLRASVGDEYLRAIRNGAEPGIAQEAAAAEMAQLVAGFNRKAEGRGFATPRSATAETDFLAAIHRKVLSAVEAPDTATVEAA